MKRKASEALGSKNKDTSTSNNTTNTNNNNASNNANNTTNNIDNQNNIDQIIEDIKSGKNTELMKRANALMKIKERTIAAADRHKKLQMKNLSELYDYEVADADAQYQKAYEEVQQRLIADIKYEDQKKKKGKDNEKDNAHEEKEIKKSLRSNTTAPNDNDFFLFGKSSLSKKKEKSILSNIGNNVTLLKSLPEECVRSDFRNIVMDIENRAKLFADGIQKVDATLKVNADSEKLEIGTETYYVGDCIIALSILSQENLFGTITSISHNDIIVKCSHGQGKFSFRIGQIKNGRIKISRDLESVEDQKIIDHAASLQKALK